MKAPPKKLLKREFLRQKHLEEQHIGTRTGSDPYTATQKPEREKRLNKKYIKSPKEAARTGQPRMGPTAVAPSPRLLAVRLFFKC